MKDPQLKSVPRPEARVDEPSCKEREPVEENEEIESKPAVSYQVGNSAIQLKQEESEPDLFNHVYDLIKAEEGVLAEAPVVHEELIETSIDQGGFIRIFFL